MVLPLVLGLGIGSLIAAMLFFITGVGMLYASDGKSNIFGVVFIIVGILAVFFGVGLIFGGP